MEQQTGRQGQVAVPAKISYWTRGVGDRGFALLTSMAFLVIFGLLGLSALQASTDELLMAGNLKNRAVAFFNAEAGIRYSLLQMEKGLREGTFSLPRKAGISVPFPAGSIPSGFDFLPCPGGISKVDDNVYAFVSVGNGPHGAGSRIEAEFSRGQQPLTRFAVFGSRGVEFETCAGAFSYDSEKGRNPSRDDPGSLTGKGDIASNRLVSLGEGSVVDGSIHLGADPEGTTASLWLHDRHAPAISGETGIDAGRFEPDPLGLRSGYYGDRFSAPFQEFDNIADGLEDVLQVRETLVISGRGKAAAYLFTRIYLEADSRLIIDVRSAPVTFYLTGTMACATGASIDVLGDPADFAVICNSRDTLVFGSSSRCTGLFYAPFADIELGPDAAAYGGVWGAGVILRERASVYHDERLQEKFRIPSNALLLISWYEVRI